MEEVDQKPVTGLEEVNECEEEDYDIEFCDDTDIDDDGDISTQKDTHSSSMFSCKGENKDKIKEDANSNRSGANSNNTKLHSFRILGIDVIYKLCSTTVLFKTETILKLIQVSKTTLEFFVLNNFSCN